MYEECLLEWVWRLSLQSILPSRVFVCINNPSSYEGSEQEWQRKTVEVNNKSLLELKALQQSNKLPFELIVIDKTSSGSTFQDKYSTVGQARF